MSKALGTSPETEDADNAHKLSEFLSGQVCLAFSNLKQKDFEKELKKYECEDFAQAGALATYDVYLEKGVDSLSGYSHSMEVYLRELGLPTKLNF